MVASSLAGCIGTDDSADDSAVTELENEIISMKDDKIAELEAEVVTLTTQHQEATAELASTRASLDSAEANDYASSRNLLS